MNQNDCNLSVCSNIPNKKLTAVNSHVRGEIKLAYGDVFDENNKQRDQRALWPKIRHAEHSQLREYEREGPSSPAMPTSNWGVARYSELVRYAPTKALVLSA